MVPDVEAVLVAHLKADDAVAAITDRVTTATPSSITEPWVRVTLIDSPSTTKPVDHALECYVQVDCFAGKSGNSVSASLLARTVRQSLSTAHEISHAGAVVSGADLSHSHAIDTSVEPAMHYYSVTGRVWMHG